MLGRIRFLTTAFHRQKKWSLTELGGQDERGRIESLWRLPIHLHATSAAVEKGFLLRFERLSDKEKPIVVS